MFFLLLFIANTWVRPVFGEELSDSTFKYHTGTQQIDSMWNAYGYNDSSWDIGYFSIGYGDNDDYVTIDKHTSVYIRKPFTVPSGIRIKDIILLIDFDDGFVAYINGKEVARVNMGAHFSPTTYDQLADRSHEALRYRRYVPSGGIAIRSTYRGI